MKAFIEQYFGLGDVIWSQGIANHLFEQGHTSVLWPVEDKYFEGCKNAYPRINFFPQSLIQPEWFQIKDKRIIGDIEVVPIRWSDSFMQVPYKDVMKAKYMMYDLDWQMWREHAQWDRSMVREIDLHKKLGLGGKRYNVINNRFGSSGDRRVNIHVSNTYENVEMKEVEGFSLFDWYLVLMMAEEIHTVSTSLLYILELLPIQKPIHLYVREGVETSFDFVSFLFTKNYILHTP